MRVGAWAVIIIAFAALIYFHKWSSRQTGAPASPAELLAIKNAAMDKCVRFDEQINAIPTDMSGIPADINELVKSMEAGPEFVEKSRGVAADTDFAPAQFGADNSELENYFQKLRTDPDVYSFAPVPTLEDQQNPKAFKTELLANVGNLNPVPFYDGIVAYEDFDGSTYQSL
jgi:hypothetical protein